MESEISTKFVAFGYEFERSIFKEANARTMLIFGFSLLMRYLNYRETLALAEKGLSRSETAKNSKGFLRWGIVLTALGIALTIGLYPLGLSNTGSNYPLGLVHGFWQDSFLFFSD